MHNIICIIDDDEIYAFGMKRLIDLRKLGRQVLMFTNGQDALAYLNANINNESRWPDVILLDINMPVMNGWEFLDKFIQQMGSYIEQYNTKMLVISSSIHPGDIAHAKGYHVVSDYLVKPITADRLSNALAESF